MHPVGEFVNIPCKGKTSLTILCDSNFWSKCSPTSQENSFPSNLRVTADLRLFICKFQFKLLSVAKIWGYTNITHWIVSKSSVISNDKGWNWFPPTIVSEQINQKFWKWIIRVMGCIQTHDNNKSIEANMNLQWKFLNHIQWTTDSKC